MKTCDVDMALLSRLFLSERLPQWRIAEILGVSQMTVSRALVRVRLRKPITPGAQYLRQHRAVIRVRGRRAQCEWCGTRVAKRFEWANLSGDYDNVWDFARLCVSCHRQFDGSKVRIRNRRSHGHL